MTDANAQSFFCIDELTESKANLKRIAAVIEEQYPVYLSNKGTGTGAGRTAAAAEWNGLF